MVNIKYLSVLVLISGLCFSYKLPAVSTPDFPKAGTTLEQLTRQYPVHWISTEQIAESLRDTPPVSVGFDIDDTLLFSSPAFFYGQQKYSPGSDDYLKKTAFWDDLSSQGWDQFSVPKLSARALMALHLKRGDDIWFITGRPQPVGKSEDLTRILQVDFNIPDSRLHGVIFAGTRSDAKVEHIRQHHITLFYGDSDNDILDARKAGAEGIRVLRPLNSTNSPMPVNGALGEKVIVNSWY